MFLTYHFSPSYYNFKSYIQSTLTYSSQVKASILESQGYYGDQSSSFDTLDDNNSGFFSRNKLFRQNGETDGEYLKEGVRFFGKLNHDLISCETGLVPGTKVTIQFDKAPSSLVLVKPEIDPEQYQFKILDINLYVPVAQLTLPVYNQFSTIFAEKSVSIHFRKTEISEVSLPKNKVEYFSDNLFTKDVPCRVIICFVKNERKLGNYKNPFEFRRYWDVPTQATEFLMQNRDQFLEEKLIQLERTLQLVIEERNKSESPKGKGRGKRSNVGSNLPSTSFLNRFRRFQNNAPSTSSEHSEEQPPPYSENDEHGYGPAPPGPVVTKRIFIKKVELLLNGAPLGK